MASFCGVSNHLAVLFEARARSARQSKTLFEIIGQKVFCRFGLRLGAESATTTRDCTFSPVETSEFTNPTGLPGVFFHTSDLKNPWSLRGSVLSTPFFAHPWLPEARNHTKTLFEITWQKVLQDSCGTEAHKDHGSVAGFWGRMPHWRYD